MGTFVSHEKERLRMPLNALSVLNGGFCSLFSRYPIFRSGPATSDRGERSPAKTPAGILRRIPRHLGREWSTGSTRHDAQ